MTSLKIAGSSDNKCKLIFVRFLIASIFSTDNVLPYHLYFGLEDSACTFALMCRWTFPKFLSFPFSKS